MAEVTCARCEKVGPALDHLPMAGARGTLVRSRICVPCWELWVEESKLLINHHGIEVADPQQRKRLYPIMAEFLKLQEL